MTDPSKASLSALATAGAVASAGLWASAGASPSTVVLALLAAFVPYAGLLSFEPGPGATRLALALAAGAGLVLVIAPPVLSDDVFRYLWDGRLVGHGIDPYRWAPADPALAPLRDDLWLRVGHPEIATIYPPVAQLLFAAGDALWHHPASLKAIALLAHLGTIPMVAHLAGPRRGRAALLYALNPLALSVGALGGHVDAVVGLAVAGFAAALLSNWAWLAAVLAGLASGLKLVGLALWPLVGLRDRRAMTLALGLALLPLVPLLSAGGGTEQAGLTHYARRWRGNDGIFALVDGSLAAGLGWAAERAGSPPGKLRLPWLRPWAEGARGTPLDLRAVLVSEKKAQPDPADFEVRWIASLLARGLVLALVLGLAVWLMRRRTEPLAAARAVLLAALLLAPQVHPWYLLWLLPLEIALERRAGLVWSAAILVAYAPLDGWVAARHWVESPWARLLEHGLVVGVLTVEEGWIRKNRVASPVHVV